MATTTYWPNSTNCDADFGQPALLPSATKAYTGESAITGANLAELSDADGNDISSGSPTCYKGIHSTFRVVEAVGTISAITAYSNGYGDTYDGIDTHYFGRKLYAWNFTTGAYVLLATDASGSSNNLISGNTASISDYVDGSGNVDIGVQCLNFDIGDSTIYADYVKLIVTYAEGPTPSTSRSRSMSMSRSRSKSKSVSRSFSRSKESASGSMSRSMSRSGSKSRSASRSQSRSGLSESLSQSLSRSMSRSLSKSKSVTRSLSRLAEIVLLSQSRSRSRSKSRSRSQSVRKQSLSASRSVSFSLSRSMSKSRSLTGSRSRSQSVRKQSISDSRSISFSRSRSMTMSRSRSMSKSRSRSWSVAVISPPIGDEDSTYFGPITPDDFLA